ncbi:MAG: DUF6488 family protein [Pseudomonadota bacterium]|mgnify:CR=1 FL=1|uniref:DUF6488 family protein n=1 Tax=Aquabacterium commune TaxID=70586 RepID=UPI003BB08E5D
MKKFISLIAFAAASVLAAPAFASGASDCHFHGATAASPETVSACSIKRQAQMVESGKLDKSWLSVKPGTPEQVDGKRGKEWKVVFKDSAASDKSKDTLFMFFTLQGNFIAANFSGK